MQMYWSNWKRILLQAVKIGIGSSFAIYMAELLGVKNAATAGTIVLLTIVATKMETVKLSMLRIVTFVMAVTLSWGTITLFHSDWVAYGVYICLIVLISECMGWKATISVNSVIGAHFMMAQDFSLAFIRNELYLVIIGITVALILNQFNNNKGRKRSIEQKMAYTETKLQDFLEELSEYLFKKPMPKSVWDDLIALEKEVDGFVADAHDYLNNNFSSHPQYYIDYFEMRLKQCGILHNLHYEMRKMKEMPEQAEIVANFVLYLADYVDEKNHPEEQEIRLQELLEDIRKEELPQTREQFESRALLYHILMDLEEFIVYKKRFVNNLDEKQKEIYWNKK